MPPSKSSSLTPSPSRSLAIGALCLIFAELCFAGVGGIVKALSTDMPPAQLVFFRNASALVVLLPLLFRHGARSGLRSLKTTRLRLHLFRAACGMVAMYLFFFVLATMTLAQAMMALLLAPFIVPIIARVWLQELIDVKTLVAMVIGFVGVGIILLMTPASETSLPGHVAWLPIVVAFICACLVATTKCTIRKLTDTEPSLRIVVYFTGAATLMSAFPLFVRWQAVVLALLPWLALMGLLAGLGQLLMTKAFALASPVKIGLLSYTSVIFAAVIGAIGWQEPITVSLVVGSLLIIWAANVTIRQRWFW
ncbi:DMT family transporter [Alteromonas sp. SM 2104]|nr:DMT family transporter [Alteromonas oceanisediminis]